MTKRNIRTPNEIVKYENYAEMVLYNMQCEEVARALIDLEDIEKVREYKWNLNNCGYVRNSKLEILLHRFVLNAPDEKDIYNKNQVDHINGNRLDNRKSNLRIVTAQQNRFNRKPLKTNKSGVPGVIYRKEYKKWHVTIQYNRKKKWIGSFETKKEAIKARIEAEKKYFGEYRNKYKKGGPDADVS